MKTITLSYYMVPNGNRQPRRTTYRMTEEDAKALHPGAVACELDAIVVEQPETSEEVDRIMIERTTCMDQFVKSRPD